MSLFELLVPRQCYGKSGRPGEAKGAIAQAATLRERLGADVLPPPLSLSLPCYLSRRRSVAFTLALALACSLALSFALALSLALLENKDRHLPRDLMWECA